ncbi:MAG TPA: isochorismatase family protein [Thermomicrobiales bacterium]|nr:isochorismatase family protein [Thermomicrobiales bacterium]
MPTADTLTPEFITDWLATLEPSTLAELVPDPDTAAFFSADVINGFFRFGPLASPRVDALTQPIVELFTRGWEHGIHEFVLLQDTHTPDNPEFRSYPPHAVAGTDESAMIPELAGLPFAEHFTVIEKNSLHPAIETGFDAWWDEHRDLTRAIVVGDCTDLCVYQLAMYLRMRANALNLRDVEVIVPINAVDTFDIPLGPGVDVGSAHPGDFFHDVFLYHMASNGIRVVPMLTSGT